MPHWLAAPQKPRAKKRSAKKSSGNKAAGKVSTARGGLVGLSSCNRLPVCSVLFAIREVFVSRLKVDYESVVTNFCIVRSHV